MTLGDVTAAQSASAVQVNLQKSQSNQQAAVVQTLLQSTAECAPCRGAYGTGTTVNIKA